MVALMIFAQGDNIWTLLMPGILIVALGWFLLIRPARQQERERRAMIAALKKGDKVIAAGGLIGIVANISEKEDEVTLKVDDGRIRVLRSSIMKVLSTEESKEQKPSD